MLRALRESKGPCPTEPSPVKFVNNLINSVSIYDFSSRSNKYYKLCSVSVNPPEEYKEIKYKQWILIEFFLILNNHGKHKFSDGAAVKN